MTLNTAIQDSARLVNAASENLASGDPDAAKVNLEKLKEGLETFLNQPAQDPPESPESS